MAIQIEHEVLNNGQPLKEVTRWAVAQRAGTLPRSYSLDIQGPEPETVGPVSISVKYDGSPAVPLIEDGSVTDRAGELQREGYRTSWAGTDEAEAIIRQSPEKKVIYLSHDYIDKCAKGYAWDFDEDNQQILGKFNFYVPGWGSQTYTWPMVIPEVPSDADSQGTFEIVIIQNSRNEIFEDLAARMGVTVEDGLPTTPFRNAYVLETSQTYIDAIRDLAAVWNPLLTMHYDGSTWRLFLLDVEGGGTAPTGGMTFDQKKVQVTSIRRQRQAVVNRVTISGAEKDETYAYSALMVPPKPRESIEIGPDYVVERHISHDTENAKALPYSDTWRDTKITKIRKEYAIDPADYKNRILLKEQVSLYEWDPIYETVSDALLSRRITTYKYLDYTAAIGQNVEEWYRIQLPGDGYPQFRLVKKTFADFGDFVQEAGETERDEVEEGLILYDYQPIGGVPKFINPQEVKVSEQNGTINVSTGSAQSYTWAQIRRRTTRYDVEDAWRVRRDTTIFNNLNATVEAETEYIPISYEQRTGRSDPDNRDRWDFEDSASIAENGYRPLVTLSVPDLKEGQDDELVEELWDRIKRKSNSEVIEAEIALPAWTPALVGERITIQETTVDVFDTTAQTFNQETIPGGDYYVTGIQHIYQSNPQAQRANLVTTLSLRNTF